MTQQNHRRSHSLDGEQRSRVGSDPGGPAPAEVPPVEQNQIGPHIDLDLTVDAPSIVIDLTRDFPNRFDAAPRWQLAVKRLIDIVGASVILVLVSPLMALTAIAVGVTSRGPVFFAQERVGYMGKRFTLLKFRSMVRDAEIRKWEIVHHNHHKSGPVFKVRNDPRMTPIGRLIRRFSIDELPQLFHVLEGKMSLVGPRPPLPVEVATYGPREFRRLTAKPGITCIWQVNGRSELDFETWVDMDIEYIENWSLWLDLKLLARTVPAVLSGEGAY
jgi:exopolysaccharide biosynthesis polyprenyl glycosylphosphotransferase